MDRLTYFIAEIGGIRRYSSINFQRQKGGDKQDFINALGLYEDTGLTPAEVAELVQAKVDGRLLVLPCKLNRKIYIIDDGKIQRCIVSEIISHGGVLAICTDADISYGVYKANIGKIVFLSEAEAQAALDRLEGK